MSTDFATFNSLVPGNVLETPSFWPKVSSETMTWKVESAVEDVLHGTKTIVFTLWFFGINVGQKTMILEHKDSLIHLIDGAKLQ